MKFTLRYILFLFGILISGSSYAQILGNGSVAAGSYETYTVTDIDYPGWDFTVTGGTITNSTRTCNDGTTESAVIASPQENKSNENVSTYNDIPPTCTSYTYTATVHWGSGTSGVVNFRNNGSVLYNLQVVICPSPVAAPSGMSFSISNCSSIAISYSGASAPGSVRWLWQTSPTGTSTSNQTTSMTSSTTGNFYLRAMSYCGEWSSTSVAVNVNNGYVAVQTIPTLAVTNNAPTFCSGQQSTNISLSNPNNVSGTTYSWSVSPSNVSGSSSATNTSSTSIAQSLTSTTGNTAGSITYNISASAGGCTSGTSTATVNVNPVPTLSVANNASSICPGQSSSITLSNPNSVSGTTYTYTVSQSNVTGATGATNTSSTTISQVLNSVTSSSSGSATYTITAAAGGCTSASNTSGVTVQAIPVLSVTNNATSICPGQSTNITLSTTNGLSGTTYSWTPTQTSVTGASSASNSSSTSIAQALSNSGNTTGNVVYAITPSTAGCAGSSVTTTVNVYPTPTAAITTQVPICSGAVASLTITNPNSVSGTVLNWTASPTNISGWANGSGSNGTVIAQTLASVTGNTAGSVIYAVTPVANGCSGTAVNTTVNVNPVPTASPSAGSANLCSGNSTTITIANNNVSGAAYTVSQVAINATIPAYESGNTITGNFYNLDGANPGSGTYTITPYTASCTGTTVTTTVNVGPALVAPTANTFLSYASDNVTLQVTVAPNAQARWYADNVTNTTLSTNATYQVTKSSSTTIFPTVYVSLRDISSSCETARTAMTGTYVAAISPASIKQEVVRTSGVTTEDNVVSLGTMQKAVTVSYVDGLSRTSQVIALNATPLGQDLVKPVEYDAFGNAAKTYLPYATSTSGGAFQTSYTTAQPAFYNNSSDKIADDSNPFALAVYEQSPLGRMLEQGNVGAAWQPGTQHTKRVTYGYNTGATNSDADEVRKFASDGSSSGYYAINTLMRTQVKDENNNIDIVFKNGIGKTVARKQQVSGTTYLQTYYVYDDFNRLKYIIPPAGVTALKNNSWALTQTIIDDHLHQFVYDNRDRLLQKKTPGQAWSYFVYDNFGRLVLTQDGNQRPQNKWAFVKYDINGRALMTGLYTNTTTTGQGNMQALVNGLTPQYEKPGTALYGYTNNGFPTANADNSALEIYTVTYFDSYSFTFNNGAAPTYDNAHLAGLPANATSYTRGKVTGSRKLILGTTNWIVSAVFYDNYGRVIQTQGNNHLNLNGLDKSSVTYDFEGKVMQTKGAHSPDGVTTTTILQTPVYDTQGRTKQLKHNINGAADQILAQYNYSELGQVIEKNLHGQAGTMAADNLVVTQYNGESNLVASSKIVMLPNYSVVASSTPYKAVLTSAADVNSRFMQSIDYRYNIRGWLTSINNAQLTTDGVMNDDANDYFGMEMNYHTDAGNGNTLYYNGNVSSIKWKAAGPASSGSAGQRSYKFSYDQSDKLLSATFQKYGTSAWDQELNTLDETMTYDSNGNIKTLKRNQNQRGLSINNGLPVVTNVWQQVDDLSYTYLNNANQLMKVDDATGNAAGFSNGTNSGDDYSYDLHGNLLTDQNKGITSNITYNLLGKVQQIVKGNTTINYTYDAAGNKLKMATTVSGVTTTSDYTSGYVYNTSSSDNIRKLAFFSSPEGRVVKSGSSFEYQYAIADHQGNTRVVFTSAAPITQNVSAGFETANQASEAGNFSNYPSGSHISTVAAYANTGTNSLYLNGGYSGQVGLPKNYKVYPGDKVQIQAFAKYSTPSGTPSNLTGFATALLNAFNLAPPVAGETGTASSAINTFGGLEASGWGDGSSDQSDPRVFVSIVLFDKNYKFIDVTYAQLTTSGALMSAAYTIKEEGYAYLYVSNEQQYQTDVYFDDVAMTYTPTNIIQSSEYYPFGLQTANSWTRDNSTNNFLYNDGSELNATTGMYDLPFRNYDASLGRFFQVDQLALNSHTMTPYHYAGNDPIGYNDPTGLDKEYDHNQDGYADWLVERYQKLEGMYGTLWAWDGVRSFAGAGGTVGTSGGGQGTLMPLGTFIDWALSGDSQSGGHWENGSGFLFGSGEQALAYGIDYVNRTDSWQNTEYGSANGTIFAYIWAKTTGSMASQATVNYHLKGVGGSLDAAISNIIYGNDRNRWIVTSLANAFFGTQMSNWGDKITWEVKNMRDNGWTYREDGGKIHITIAVGALLDPTLAYLTIGHELIHAEDFLNGNRDQWRQAIIDKGFTDELLDSALKNVMEYHAYSWDAHLEGQFRVNYNAQSEFKSLTNELNDYGLMYLFRK